MDAIYKSNGNLPDFPYEYNTAYYKETAKTILHGKVLISFGDSYTVGMKSKLDSVAENYGMAHDGRGIVSSSISTAAVSPMVNRVDTIVSDYSSGYTIDGVTYHADDVGVITFMGGANDGCGILTGIGSGIHETDHSTIYGGLNHIFSTLQENFTKAKIICVIQPSNYIYSQSKIDEWIVSDEVAQRIGFDNMTEAKSLTPVQLSNYCQGIKEAAVKDAAWYYGIPILDMFHGFPSVLNPTNRATYWMTDKLHLTSAGYQIIADAIDDKIGEVVARNN